MQVRQWVFRVDGEDAGGSINYGAPTWAGCPVAALRVHAARAGPGAQNRLLLRAMLALPAGWQ